LHAAADRFARHLRWGQTALARHRVQRLPHQNRDFGHPAEAKMESRKSARKRAFFAHNWQKRRVFWLKNGGFSGFLFTDKYTWMIDEDVYYLSFAWMNLSHKSGFKGRGVVSPLFFFSF
jgi:hypothetical protein